MKGVPPPAVHMHLRLYDVSKIPLGKVGSGIGRGAEASEEETKIFDEWLRERWVEKDQLIDDFHATGGFKSKTVTAKEKSNGHANGNGHRVEMDRAIEIPLVLRSNWEIPDAWCYLAPVWVSLGALWAYKSLFLG
jgi:lysocardiolipin and lysophospholipid acyltransferase